MVTRDEIIAGFSDILCDVVGVDVEDVAEDKRLTADLDVDSLSMVEVIVATEERFGVKITDDDARGPKAMGDAVSFIGRHWPEMATAASASGPAWRPARRGGMS